MPTDLYELLGVAHDADARAIKKAYHRLALENHPDVNPDDPEAEERFKEAVAAFQILSDPERRRKYDAAGLDGLRGSAGKPGRSSTSQRTGHAERTTQTPGRSANRQSGSRASSQKTGARTKTRRRPSVGRVFESVFGGRSPMDTSHMSDVGGFEAALERGRDLSAVVEVDLPTVVTGGRVEVRLPDRVVPVDIPAGIEDGESIVLRGQGGRPPSEQSLPGDLKVEVRVLDHPRLSRHGLDLHLDFPLTVAEAILGGEVTVTAPHGSYAVRIPRGVHSGTRLRLAGQGITRGSRTGDLFVVVAIRSPDRIDAAIEDAARAIDAGYSEPVREE